MDFIFVVCARFFGRPVSGSVFRLAPAHERGNMIFPVLTLCGQLTEWNGPLGDRIWPERRTRPDAHLFAIVYWLGITVSVNLDIDEINANDLIAVFIGAAKRLQRSRFFSAVCNPRGAMIGCPPIITEEDRVSFQEMIGCYDLQR